MDKAPFDQLLMDVIREMGILRTDQVLPGWSLSLSEVYALNLLAERAPLSQHELGAALKLEKSSVTRLVQQLERRGWVVRERDARDSRLRLLRLSPVGERMTREMHQHMHARHAEFFNLLSSEEQSALLQGLSALQRVMHHVPWPPNPPRDPSAV